MCKRVFLYALLILLVFGISAALASNMAFKLQRDLAVVPGGLSYYLMSLPYHRSFADLWNSQTGEFGQDSLVDSADVLATWFTDGDGSCDGAWECDGSISLLYFVNDPTDPDLNRWKGQTIAGTPFGVSLSGEPFDILNAGDPGRGYLVQVPSGTSFPIFIVGSHDPLVTEFVMTYEAGALNKHPYSLPYHTVHADSQELLDSIPDPDYRNGVSLLRFINDPADSQFNRWVGQTVLWSPFGGKQFSGTPFPLEPGHGYLLELISEPETPGGTVAVPGPHF
jgi:hypothetical protein